MSRSSPQKSRTVARGTLHWFNVRPHIFEGIIEEREGRERGWDGGKVGEEVGQGSYDKGKFEARERSGRGRRVGDREHPHLERSRRKNRE